MQEKSFFEVGGDNIKNIIGSSEDLRRKINLFSDGALKISYFSGTDKERDLLTASKTCAAFLQKLDSSIKKHGYYLIDGPMRQDLLTIFHLAQDCVQWYKGFIGRYKANSPYVEGKRAEAFDELEDINLSLSVFEVAINGLGIDIDDINGLQEHPEVAEVLEKEISEITESVNKKMHDHLSLFSNGLDELLKTHRDRIEASRNRIDKMDSNLNLMFSILASKSIAGGFMKNAESEKEAANIFRGLAVALMLAMAVKIWFDFENNVGVALPPESLYWRLLLGLFFSFVIGYLIRQSAVHRGQQFYYQQKAFDMAAINPYLANMPEDKQFEIKRHIAERIFVPASTMQGGDSGGFGAQEIVSKIIDKLELPKSKD